MNKVLPIGAQGKEMTPCTTQEAGTERDFRTLEDVRQVGLNGLMFKRLGRLLRLIFGHKAGVLWPYVALIASAAGYQACAYYIGIYIPEFYTFLLGRDVTGFNGLLGRLLGLILATAASKALMSLFGGLFALRTRRILVHRMHALYVAPQSLYQSLSHDGERMDNPHQRVTQDVDKFALSIAYILTQVVLSPALFVYYTYDLVKTAGWTAPVTLLAYFIASCLATRFVIPQIAKVVFVKERQEGDFRYLHVRLSDEAEAIALLRGENRERLLLECKLGQVLAFQRLLVYWNMLMAFIIGIVDYLGTVISYVIVAVPILNGSIESPDAYVKFVTVNPRFS
jgi:ATP-binding cassette subfamily D (ALD) protein 4